MKRLAVPRHDVDADTCLGRGNVSLDGKPVARRIGARSENLATELPRSSFNPLLVIRRRGVARVPPP